MEIVLLLGLALMLFGAKRLPEIGRSLGTGMREFKETVSGDRKIEIHEELPQHDPASETSANGVATVRQLLPEVTREIEPVA